MIYHIRVEDQQGTVVIDEERETFVYASPDPDSESHWTFTSKINFLKVFGPIAMRLMKDKFGGGC